MFNLSESATAPLYSTRAALIHISFLWIWERSPGLWCGVWCRRPELHSGHHTHAPLKSTTKALKMSLAPALGGGILFFLLFTCLSLACDYRYLGRSNRAGCQIRCQSEVSRTPRCDSKHRQRLFSPPPPPWQTLAQWPIRTPLARPPPTSDRERRQRRALCAPSWSGYSLMNLCLSSKCWKPLILESTLSEVVTRW